MILIPGAVMDGGLPIKPADKSIKMWEKGLGSVSLILFGAFLEAREPVHLLEITVSVL